jgi:hypothetical protein
MDSAVLGECTCHGAVAGEETICSDCSRRLIGVAILLPHQVLAALKLVVENAQLSQTLRRAIAIVREMYAAKTPQLQPSTGV